MGTNITGIGNANAIGFKSRVTGGAYFPPELKDALVGVWSAYGKSNDSTDRNIIKNKIKDRGGDFIISNAAFKLNSGFGGFVEDFTSWDRIDSSTAEISNDGSKIKCINTTLNVQYLFNSINRDIPSFKVKISNFTKGDITYYYRKEDGIEAFLKINPLSVVNSDKVIELPKSYNTVENGTGGRGGFYSSNINIGVTITQIPSFEGAFVTDGIDDLITSTKTVQEMLGGSNEITVVSMMANLDSRKILCNSNYSNTNGYNVRNTLEPNGVITMLGYTDKNGTTNNLNLIMGDKDSIKLVDKVNFNSDYVFYPAQYYKAYYQVAWYWTFIANRVLTEDEINLVIEKYNLDRPGEIVKPDVYYDIKRQKITNENHSAFDDKLIDYSGNGYDAKLYNFGWKEDSGIGKYETDFTDWKKSFKVTSFDSESIKFTSDVSWVLLYHPSSIGEDIPSFKVRIKLYGKGTLYYNYITQEGKYTNVAVKSEIFETPICYNTKYTGEKGVNVGFTIGVTSGECSGTITQIPEYENALVLDGVDDYGKVTGLPILKDYTVAADYIRTFAKENAQDSPILSKSKVAGSGAFLFNYLNADSITNSYSFGTNNILKEINDSERKIYYLSKYASDGHNVNAGSAVDYDTMWLGTYRDNTSSFFTGALYFAMLFPYSLSEFLLERQIKKARAGTLYPNQVEFRPIIPEDENITKIDYFVVNSGTWTVIKPGDYVDVGARIVLNVYTKLPYKIAGASSTAFTGMTVGPSTALNIWDVKGYIKDKTPQKIKLTLAVNEDIVQWNPAITSNLLDSFTASSWYLNGWDNTLTAGTWIKKTDRVFFKATFKTELYGLETATFGGTECVVSKADNWSDSKNIWDIRMLGTVGDLSQIFNLDVYELIRFEDIVQPYPVLLRFKDENGNEVSWGGKFRVGSTITRIGSAADSNLLPNIYNIFGLLLNDNQVTSSKVIVEKTMVFKAKSAYIFDNNEPKCILSPSRLRIPNSSYKILSHIPDISGHGNHGVIHNSAYEGMSGVNGYPYDYNNSSFWADSSLAKVVSGELVEYFAVKNSTGFSNITSGVYKGKIKVTGVTKAISENKISRLRIYSNSTTDNELIDITQDGNYNIDIKGVDDANRVFFYAIPSNPNDTAVVRLTEPIYIEQVGNYEGSICFDGVDDYMDIPSLSIGGKQVLMKTNWLKSPTLLYDQRASGSFAILTTKEDDATNPRIAYQARNQDGKTYIDGIENNYIETYSLKGITHNITVTNPSAGSGVVPVIGANTGKSSGFAKMALYDFMLFDEVSTNEEIKQLNDIVGIEGNYVQRPPYYWDTHGKSNLDGDRGTIPQLGTAEDYSFTSFDNEIDWYLSSSNYIDVVSRNGYKITLKNLSTGIDGWRFQNSTVKRFILNDIPFKIKSNKTIRVYWDMHYNAISSTELRQKVVSVTTINPNEDTLISLRHLTEEELTELNVNKSTMYYLLWFDVSTLAVNEEVTIEMLPVEGGRNLWLNNYGFAYDKMSGYEGYSFKSFNDSQSWNIRGDSTGVEIISRNGYSMTVKKLVQNLDWQISNNEYRYPTILDKEVPFKCKSNKNVGLIWQLKYKTEGATSDTTVTLINQQLTPNVPLEISLPYKTQDELTELGAVSTSVYYLLYFSNTLLEIGEEYTVEMLPLYPNGLVYDGVDDYSENTSIPAFTDYTYIFKRTILNIPSNGATLLKGSHKTNGGAFIADYGNKWQFNFGQYNTIQSIPDGINWQTSSSFNGTSINRGTNTDDEGITVSRFSNGYTQMVFYKLMLYPRTTDMLTINMIKNMMAEDGIIDIQGKLFTDKFTGDFNLDFNKDFLIGN